MKQSTKNKINGQVYANLLCDFMFKRLFGSEANKDILIEFLNMVLEDKDIEEVNFIPTEHLGLTEDDRKAVFDISCRCRDGQNFIIEMQKGYQTFFRERALYYTTYPINEQGRHAKEQFIRENSSDDSCLKFEWDYNLKPVAVVAILNFKFDHSPQWPVERFHSSYRLREDSTSEVMTEALRFVFLELARFKKHLWELETMFDKWMYLLKHMHEMVDIPEQFSDPLFSRLFILSKIGKFTPEELLQYEKSMNDMSDYYNTINTAAEEAEKRGIAKGREEAKLEDAKKLKELGVDIQTIIAATGLGIDIVSKL